MNLVTILIASCFLLFVQCENNTSDQPLTPEKLVSSVTETNKFNDQVPAETNVWRPITSSTSSSSALNEDLKESISRAGNEREFSDVNELDPLSDSMTPEDYVHKALELRQQLLDGNNHFNGEYSSSFSDYASYGNPKRQIVKKPFDDHTDRYSAVAFSERPFNNKALTDENLSHMKFESHYSTLPTPTTSFTSVTNNSRPRRRMRNRRRQNVTSNAFDTADSSMQYSYMSPEEAVKHMRRPYVSKSATIKNSEHSTSTNYYYDPIVTEEVEDINSKAIELEKMKKNIHSMYDDFDNKYGYGFKTSVRPQENIDPYFFTHPTPNPVTSSSTTTTTVKPFRGNQEYNPGTHTTYRPQSRDSHRRNIRSTTTRSPNNIKANVITHSDAGSKELTDPHNSKVYKIRTRPNQKMRIVIRTTPTPKADTEDITSAAESQVVSSIKLPNHKSYTPAGNVKHHTPRFELNDYEKTRVPVYYNVDLSDVNVTVHPPFNNHALSTTSSPVLMSSVSSKPEVAKNVLSKYGSTDRRHMMTYSPEDDLDEVVTYKPDLNKGESDLAEAESKKKKYVVLYHIDDESKQQRKRRPGKPSHVTQQIHYHHHGSNNEKKYSTSGDKHKYEDVEDDEGPDVTHTHHEYVHFDNEPAVTHHYTDGPMTDHYDVARPASNAVFDLKTAKDYDLRHTASHDLDTRHVPVSDYATLKSSHLYNSGKVETTLSKNSYGERPFYHYDSERQVSQYDNEAYGSAPHKSIAQLDDPYDRHIVKVVDPNHPDHTVEITKDDYIRHVKLAVEKYMKAKDPPAKSQYHRDQPFRPSRPISFTIHEGGDSDEIEEASNTYLNSKPPPIRDMTPPKGYQKPIERPLDFSEAFPISGETYNRLKEGMDPSSIHPVKPVTLPPRRPVQLKKLAASTPGPFNLKPNSGKFPSNFKMNNLKLPKNVYNAGKPLQDSIYNLQENIGNAVDLTIKNLRSTNKPIDFSALEIGQLYPHNNMPNFEPSNGPKQKLKFNQQVYHEINAMMNKNVHPFRDAEASFTHNFQNGKQRPSVDSYEDDSEGAGAHVITHNTIHYPSDLGNAPIHIINGIPVANPYNIDMDTLKYMLGGMRDGLVQENDKNDPFKMKTLKSIPNVASVPSVGNYPTNHKQYSKMFDQMSSGSKNIPVRSNSKPNLSNGSFGIVNSGFANNPFSNNAKQWESNFSPSWNAENVAISSVNSMTTSEPQLYLKAIRRVPKKKMNIKTLKEVNTNLLPPPKPTVTRLIAIKKTG